MVGVVAASDSAKMPAGTALKIPRQMANGVVPMSSSVCAWSDEGDRGNEIKIGKKNARTKERRNQENGGENLQSQVFAPRSWNWTRKSRTRWDHADTLRCGGGRTAATSKLVYPQLMERYRTSHQRWSVGGYQQGHGEPVADIPVSINSGSDRA